MKRVIESVLLSGLVLAGAAAQTPAPGAAGATSPAQAAQTRQQQESQLRVSGGLPAEALTEEQRTKLREVSAKSRKEQTALYEKMRTVRTDLDKLTRADQIDEQAIRSKALELGKIEGELAVIRAKNYSELRALLPKEQFEQLQRPPVVEHPAHRIPPSAASVGVPPPVRPSAPGAKRESGAATPRSN